MRSKTLWTFGCLLLIAAISHTATAQSSCSTTYDPTKYMCAPVEISDWRFKINGPANYSRGPFETEAEAIAALPSAYVTPASSSWCSMTPTSVEHDYFAPSTYAGIIYVRGHRAHYDSTG